MYIWCNLFLKELTTSPLNTCKSIAIVVEKPIVTLCVSVHRSSVHRQYYGKVVKGGRVTYVNCSPTITTEPNNLFTKPFSYY